MQLLFLFGSSLATNTPEANQSPWRSQAERKCPRRGRHFHSCQSSPFMSQRWSPRASKVKGKGQSLRWGLQHSYLTMRLTPLFFSPEQKLLILQGYLTLRQRERMWGWPLRLPLWCVSLSFRFAFYWSLGSILCLLIYSLTSFLPRFVCFSIFLS